ncbi:helix-turn-helix domain-containing protein [Anaplasma bovis]|uniref:helix-turn-helix domain-containing protein n=1 Tax=Anaplasma bovis TaxID=186733 RepID=UPI002FF3C9FE
MRGKRCPSGQKVKLQILNIIRNTIYKSQWNQTVAAKIIGVDQPKISQIINGKAAGFSLERLLVFLLRLGCDVHLSIHTDRNRVDYSMENSMAKIDLDSIDMSVFYGDSK